MGTDEVEDPEAARAKLSDLLGMALRAGGVEPVEGGEGPRDLAAPVTSYRCQYVTDWGADKTRWGLTVDATERDALADRLGQCSDMPITVTLAR